MASGSVAAELLAGAPFDVPDLVADGGDAEPDAAAAADELDFSFAGSFAVGDLADAVLAVAALAVGDDFEAEVVAGLDAAAFAPAEALEWLADAAAAFVGRPGPDAGAADPDDAGLALAWGFAPRNLATAVLARLATPVLGADAFGPAALADDGAEEPLAPPDVAVDGLEAGLAVLAVTGFPPDFVGADLALAAEAVALTGCTFAMTLPGSGSRTLPSPGAETWHAAVNVPGAVTIPVAGTKCLEITSGRTPGAP